MFVASKPQHEKWHYISMLLRKQFKFDRIPGGVKMACSSIALAFVMWIILESGVPVLMAATSALKTPVVTIQSYLNSYAESDWGDVHRVRRAARQLPVLENKELSSSIALAESQLSMLGRLEKNLMAADVKVKLGSVLHRAYIESMPSTEALAHGKDAAVVVKASHHLGGKFCNRMGIDNKNCALQVSKLSLSATSLGAKCSAHHRQTVFCSEVARYRSHDGSCNHPHHPAWGLAHTAYRRILPAHYADGFQKPHDLPSARTISVGISSSWDSPDPSVTLAAVQWAHFVASDLAHTAVSKMYNTGGSIACCDSEGNKLSPRYLHPACFPVSVPSSDPVYATSYRNCMSYVRSLPALRPDCTFGALEQMNQATHVLDGSMLYGNSEEKANALREWQYGRLRTVGRQFLPTIDSINVNCHVAKDGSCYQTGDPRVNADPHQVVMHTLWVREHNRIAGELASLNSHWSDERLYEEARRIVIAEIEHITYNEWLPVVLGVKYIREEPALQVKPTDYSNLYREDVDPAVSNSFTSAAIQSFDSMIEDNLRLYDEDRIAKLVSLTIHSFYSKNVMHSDEQLDALVRGLATQSAQQMDLHYSTRLQHKLHSMTNMTDPQALDRLSLDIQRGRDHGLPSYNAFRRKCGLTPASHFSDLLDTIPRKTVDLLKKLYKRVDEIDLLVGGLSEYASEGLVGPVLKCILSEQFKRTRIGDRFFYDNGYLPSAFTKNQLNEIKKTSLARVFCDNTNNVLTMQPYVFYKPVSPSNELVACSEEVNIHRMRLALWLEEKPTSALEGL